MKDRVELQLSRECFPCLNIDYRATSTKPPLLLAPSLPHPSGAVRHEENARAAAPSPVAEVDHPVLNS
ncbi:hypothetical protein ZWY2020_025622 [Hordeum vulgare]|nr:hypothetical protein ZWY2020_025622 [Hordeum vulgare]